METVKVTKTPAKKVEKTAQQIGVSSDKLVSIAPEDFFERKKKTAIC